METPLARPTHTAVLLAVGSELTTGETRDTNSGDLARSLSAAGVEVAWISALPDSLETVTRGLRDALVAADLVITTGGLGPTPDDLTREAIAAVCDEQPSVDPELSRWLRNLFERRGIPFAEINLKQAWLIPSATPIPNDRGTAPGWWVDRPDGRIVLALPGPPSEMRPMWQTWALPRLGERGLGRDHATRTYRLTGIGESLVAELLGEPLLRGANPVVATYARADAVDVRISAIGEPGRTAAELVDVTERVVLACLGQYVWGRDDDTWTAVLGRDLARLDWAAALVEVATGGAATRLFGDAPWLTSARVIGPDDSPQTAGTAGSAPAHLSDLAEQSRTESGAAVGLAVRTVESGLDTIVEIAVAGPLGPRVTSSTAFLGGAEGRRRAAIAAAASLHAYALEAARSETGRQRRVT